MHRIDADSHVANLFDEGDPGVPRAPTQVDADWLNAVQETLCDPIEAMGLTLVKGDHTQLTAALTTAARTNATLDAGWTGGTPVPRYYKDSTGCVCLEGKAQHSSDGHSQTMFTLPTGFRPPDLVGFPVRVGDGSVCLIGITSAGLVVPRDAASIGGAVSTSLVWLDGIRFHP